MLLNGFPGIAALVERRIEEAAARGEFDNLPGAGQPLDLDEDFLVPEELRIAHRILKNSGYVPPEAQHLAEVNHLIAQIERDEIAPHEGSASVRRLRALLIQLEISGREATSRAAWSRYQDALATRLART
ncbi:MAG: DnaJ family domain-containing protein [Gemmatimonadota bacterium]